MSIRELIGLIQALTALIRLIGVRRTRFVLEDRHREYAGSPYLIVHDHSIDERDHQYEEEKYRD